VRDVSIFLRERKFYENKARKYIKAFQNIKNVLNVSVIFGCVPGGYAVTLINMAA
jgi:hypothetical protein